MRKKSPDNAFFEAFPFICRKCFTGIMVKKVIKNFETEIDGKDVVIPVAVVSVCGFCGIVTSSGTERKRWKTI